MSVLGELLAEVFFAPNPKTPARLKEATMVNAIMLQLFRARTGSRRIEPTPERLRRAGYADGERRPRVPRHWANR